MTKLSTLCYIEREEKYFMLHRTVKENDVNHDKWIGVGGHLEWVEKSKVQSLELWEGDKIFFDLLEEEREFFSLKLVYNLEGVLQEAVLDGKILPLTKDGKWMKEGLKNG